MEVAVGLSKILHLQVVVVLVVVGGRPVFEIQVFFQTSVMVSLLLFLLLLLLLFLLLLLLLLFSLMLLLSSPV